MNKTIYIVIAVIIIALGAWLWMNPAEVATEPTSETAAETQVEQPAATADIDAVNVDDADFTSIDADLNSL